MARNKENKLFLLAPISFEEDMKQIINTDTCAYTLTESPESDEDKANREERFEAIKKNTRLRYTIGQVCGGIIAAILFVGCFGFLFDHSKDTRIVLDVGFYISICIITMAIYGA